MSGPDRRTTTEFPAVLPRRVLSDAPSTARVPLKITVPVPAPVMPPVRTPSPIVQEEAPPPPGSGSPRAPMASLDLEDAFEADTNPAMNSIPIPQPSASTRHDRAILTVLTGVNAGQVFSLEGNDNVIGRSREASIRIDDVGISRKHTRISRTQSGGFVVEDMGSTNGTFVAARRVDRLELRPGDRVQVGPNVLFRFSLIDSTEEQLARSLYEASTRDALTRVYNRKYFHERLESEVAYALRHKTQVAVVLFDLDHFKKTNDTHGHLAGDVVLRTVAAAVQKTIRLEDVLARYGGEEFVIIVRGIEHEKVAVFAERVRRAVEFLDISYESTRLRATISIGAASISQLGETLTAEALLLLADERLYRSKDAGRNRVSS
jgi:two-component system, cell cycle response regulator